MQDVTKCKLGFVSQPLRVDFIAYHDIQAQAGMSAFEAMSQHFECRWLIGGNQNPSGAEAAVLLDHTQHHPNIKKSADGYKYLFYMSHDLGDVNVYEIEKQRLKNFNIIFVPGPLHASFAQQALGPTYAQPSLAPTRVILEVGWPKYDRLDILDKYARVKQQILNFPYKTTILYAPTWATREWETILPLIRQLKCNLIIKNHIYVNPGQAYPLGLEKEYAESIQSAKEMEEQALAYNLSNILVAPREMNICSLFPFVNILISDQSSVNIEFLSFGGMSIETGRFNHNPNQIQPQSSLISKEVLFVPMDELKNILASEKFAAELLSKKTPNSPSSENIVRYKKNSGALIAMLIDRYVSFWQVISDPIHRSSGFSQLMDTWVNLLEANI